MKKFAVPLALGGLAAGTACAQGTVTLYGIVDQSIRFTTNANQANNSQVQLTNGAVTNSRFGLRGEEDLGSGMKTLFRLENGFDPDTGRVNQNGRLFGRHAYVGLSGGVGTLKLGRQSTEGFNLFGDFDPLTVGNYTANAWPYFMTGGRVDNAVSYDGTFGGLSLGASYGFGELPGNLKHGSYWGVRAAYNQGNLGIGAVYQEIRNAASETQRMWGVAGRYAFGPAKLFAGYLGGRDATGMVDGMLNDPSRSVSYGSFAANPRKDMTFYTGLTWQAGGALALTGVVYHDSIRNVNGVAGQSGQRLTGVLLAEYALSRRTQLYGTVDYNRVSGGAASEMPGRGNQTGVAVGVRHVF
ncbi:porin [Cupriavidus neocaledonicus]|uniref:Membrane protein n=1 Tax=Cupriavidus neocaledonicus TaxID=1040979 RepID=A0A375HQG8_9BURK|nr:porin [Cupriavidus neocaledonicus]SOZ39290.1 Outer membrane porin [Cupriavidus neocaledonicus]SPD59037.1 Membrane protein [Cupriavidus neocaledonicus]